MLRARAAALLFLLSACTPTPSTAPPGASPPGSPPPASPAPASPPPSAATPALAPSSAPAAEASTGHHHELHLPPVGPQVTVVLGDKQVDVVLANVPHQGSTVTLPDLWKAAFPAQDPTTLTFDLFGSDGFHPAARPACARPLEWKLIAAAYVDLTTHDVAYEEDVKLPGCYFVKALVRMVGSR